MCKVNMSSRYRIKMRHKKFFLLTQILLFLSHQVCVHGKNDDEEFINAEVNSQSPLITFKEIGSNYFGFHILVPDECYPINRTDQKHLGPGFFWVDFNQKNGDAKQIYPEKEQGKSTWKYFATGLEPETTYNVSVRGCDDKQEQPFLKASINTTCKPLEIKSVVPEVTSATIIFKNDNLSCNPLGHIFEISTNGRRETITEPFNMQTYSILLKNLSPNTNYKFYMKELNNLYSSDTDFQTCQQSNDKKSYGIFFNYLENPHSYTYGFNWVIQDKRKQYFGTIEGYLISWKFNRKACPVGLNQSEASIQIDKDKTEHDLKLYPYTNYIFKLTVYGSDDHSGDSQEISLSTKYKETFSEEELPTIERIEPNQASFEVFFKYLNCSVLKGEMQLNYRAVGVEDWCESLSLKENIHFKFPFENKRMVISSLTPYCTYNVTIFISRTGNDWKNARHLTSFMEQTKSEVIAPPVEDLLVVSKGMDHIHLRWRLSPKPTGSIKEYYICGWGCYFAKVNKEVTTCNLWPQYFCVDVNMNFAGELSYIPISIVGINENDLSRDAIEKYANATNYRKTTNVYTMESYPRNAYDVKATWNDDNFLEVFWKHPNETNGILKCFSIGIVIQYDGSSNFDTDIYKIKNRDEYKFEYHKLVKLRQKIQQKYQKIQVTVTAENNAGISIAPKLIEVLDPPPPKEFDGAIKLTDLVLTIPKPARDVFLEKIVIFKGDSSQENNRERKNELDKLKELLEKEIDESELNKTCKIYRLIYYYNIDSEDNHDQRIVIDGSKNGFFQSGASYAITLFIVNEANDYRKVRGQTFPHVKSKSSKSDRPDDRLTAITVFVISGGILFLLPTLAYLIYRYRHKLRLRRASFVSAFKRDSIRDDVTLLTINDDFVEDSIHYQPANVIPVMLFKPVHSKRVKVDSFAKYIKKSLENGELQRQHKLFPNSDELMLQDNTFTCNYGKLPNNTAKNRYNKIIPYDHTRVTLNKIPGDQYSDYINANFINGYKLPKAYIATQGPKKNTLNDFWKMIWEQNVKNIVMLSHLYTGDKKECEIYWPDENRPTDFNGILVEFVDIQRHPTFDVRNFKVQHDCNSREVSQVQFKSWPAQGQPLYPQTLVPLLQKMLTLPYTSRSPIVVHCSAGVGRTGTIILCDICLRMAGAEGAVDILGMLEGLRTQRPNMVNNVEQYKLAHLAILACLTDWNTSIPCDGNFETTVEDLLDDGIVPMNVKYLKESQWQDEAMKCIAVQNQIVVPEKNRYCSIVPEQQYQIFLELLPNQDETSAYINAVRVNSFSFSDRYIVTQQPLPTTIGDFWRMVVEQQSIVVINLNEIDLNDNTSVQFWPEEETKMELGDGVEIQHVKTHKAKEFSIITVGLSYRPNEFEQTKLTVEMLSFKDWHNYQAIPDNMDHFVSFVADSTVICRKSQPVVVTCHDGATASGLFVAMSNLIEQMKLEKECDICKSVRTIRNCRKQFVEKEAQLGFLYNAAVFYLNNFGVYHDLENFSNIMT